MSTCRFCGTPLRHLFADLGMCPVANSLVTEEMLSAMEPFYPLRALVCDQCFLVQSEEFESPAGIFTAEYSYFSSYSSSWLAHASEYADRMVEQLGLGPDHTVVEVGSNDGYLLQWFHERGVRVLGVEPAANVAQEAIVKGIPTIVRFFDAGVAAELAPESSADLLIGNNVLAHMPDVSDFVAGMKVLLKPAGVITVEFPHLMRLVDEGQFDTIYHEHFSYFSLGTVTRIFERHGLRVFDVEELPTHGGSLRVHACHADHDGRPPTERVTELAQREETAGYGDLEVYTSFGERMKATKREVLRCLIDAKEEGRTIVGYGAPAKGTTLLNYCGIGTDFLDYTVDKSPHKQGCYLPGVRIPIHAPDEIRRTRPDYVFILPWNLKDEIVEEMSYIREWGGRFLGRTPDMTIL
ncbi:MAG TPA: class I SAM-dependent methyltransferase [Solirubrobacteraceae bacterium]|nr:class I SAM-dependent methyltransferase [Solirubrobacteraceae bacterium]